MEEQTLLRQFAFHEAGHALFAWMRGLPFEAVIRVAEDQPSGGYVRAAPHSPTVWGVVEAIISAQAGIIAQAELTGRDVREIAEENAVQDVLVATYYSSLICSNDQKSSILLKQCRDVASTTIKENWSSVCVIASMLEKRKVITEKQVRNKIRRYTQKKYALWLEQTLQDTGVIDFFDRGIATDAGDQELYELLKAQDDLTFAFLSK